MYYHGQSQELRATRTPYEHSKTGTRYHGEDDESLCYRTSNVRENTGAYERDTPRHQRDTLSRVRISPHDSLKFRFPRVSIPSIRT